MANISECVLQHERELNVQCFIYLITYRFQPSKECVKRSAHHSLNIVSVWTGLRVSVLLGVLGKLLAITVPVVLLKGETIQMQVS